MKIRPVVAELFRKGERAGGLEDRRTDRHNEASSRF